ncbi:MAG: hypothetical protein ABSB89_00995 [Candidatus Bathyarchaeia archaeon]|jgi:hypothetical protein
MANSEEYTKIETVDYDFYLNNERTVFIKNFKARYVPIPLGLVGALASEAILHAGKSKAKEKNQEMKDMTKDMTLDEKLQKIKGSFAVAHNDVEWICLSKGQLNFKANKVWKFLKLNKEQFSQFSSLLPNIQLLKDKTKITY